ncbi:prolipoprotein diacylglyceryl transferase [Beggiatoa leptomitoformis]|uniref:Phosphatidylglycerol--prolipoprotein diacylglyceryl transferase n=1 Tax=Beggiatoa leptomitoformis TaxID=288004 RepID=A0A2N9Y9X8_9GAMM|nr:prolipoprotein diacylglyceryl transferase [Beggiatoa leptomitoformis]ALG67306.1 prolipoprotein diacylglyceryl transferase [Beggiatoa leptomitoformis]AUI67263.1 prolipoprotein diacylglyceryl transferase [Beggiatoa leptomitoformis]
MLTYPTIDPVLVQIGPFPIHWYGLMYLIGLLIAWGLGHSRAKRPDSPVTPEQLSDLVFYSALGVVLGGRLGYILFYGFPTYLQHPLAMFEVWRGGMSFHGGLIGVLIAMAIFAHKNNRTFFQMTDFIAPLVPPGLAAGRLGNFINGELWGHPTQSIWGMQITQESVITRLPQNLQEAVLNGMGLYPTQLFQAALEGVALFVILWIFSKKPRPTMAVSGLFLIGYGVFRFIVEFVRMPDAHIGYLAFDWLTMGQLLSFPMIIIGIGLMLFAYRRHSVQQV